MTTTTRRAVLAGAPAVATATLAAGTGINAVAVAMTRASEPDSIFAVIRAHQTDLEAMVYACNSGHGDEADFVTPDRWPGAHDPAHDDRRRGGSPRARRTAGKPD
jgi:hypothetical protein